MRRHLRMGISSYSTQTPRKMFDIVLPFHELSGLAHVHTHAHAQTLDLDYYDHTADEIYQHNHSHYGGHYAQHGNGSDYSPYIGDTSSGHDEAGDLHAHNSQHYGAGYANHMHTHGTHLENYGVDTGTMGNDGSPGGEASIYNEYGQEIQSHHISHDGDSGHAGHITGGGYGHDHLHVNNGHMESGDPQINGSYGAEMRTEVTHGANLPPSDMLAAPVYSDFEIIKTRRICGAIGPVSMSTDQPHTKKAASMVRAFLAHFALEIN